MTNSKTAAGSQHKTVFLHNWRCAGNAISMAFLAHFGDQCFKLGSIKGRENSYKDFLESADGDIRFYLGHFAYGVHERIQGEVRYITNIRFPYERLISGYNKWGSGNLEDWLSTEPEADNGMTRRLAGIGSRDEYGTPSYDFVEDRDLGKGFRCNREAFERACATLNKCRSVVLVDKFVESFLLLEERLNLRPLILCQGVNFNKAPHGVITYDVLPPGIKDAMAKRSKYDVKLYGMALARIENELSNCDEDFFEAVRIRRLLHKIMEIDPSEPTSEQAAKRVIYGVKSLFGSGLKDDALKVHFLTTLDPIIGNHLKQYEEKYYGEFVTNADFRRVVEYYLDQSYYSDRLDTPQ